jgi:nucleoside-diphosphate-sugar epimerase
VSEADGFGSRFLPYDHYGRAKVAAEKLVQEAHAEGGYQITVLRPGLFYGPRDHNAYGLFASIVKKGLAFRFGDGENRIPLVYMGNLARAIWITLQAVSPTYRVYLYAFDGNATQNDYLESVARATGSKRKPISIPLKFLLGLATLQENLSAVIGYRLPCLLPRSAAHLFGSDWNFDQSSIEKELLFTPQISYEEGFAATEAWYQKEFG